MEEFTKVSLDVFFEDSIKYGFISDKTPKELVQIIWENLKQPESKPGKYVFYSPWPFYLVGETDMKLPSGFSYKDKDIILTIRYKTNRCISDGDKVIEIQKDVILNDAERTDCYVN